MNGGARLAYSIDIMAVSIKSADGRISISVDEGSEVRDVVVNGEHLSVGSPRRRERQAAVQVGYGVFLGLLVAAALYLAVLR